MTKPFAPYSDWIWDSCYYNIPTASDVVAIMIDDRYDINQSNWDILLKLYNKGLKIISEFYLSYDLL